MEYVWGYREITNKFVCYFNFRASSNLATKSEESTSQNNADICNIVKKMFIYFVFLDG